MASKLKNLIDIKRTRILQQRKRKLRIEQFKPTQRSKSGRVAEFLIWASNSHPKEIITYEEITQAVLMYSKRPNVGAKEVKLTISCIPRARVLVKKRFKQDIVTEKGIGARVTVDSMDVMQNSVIRDIKAHEVTAKKLESTVELVRDEELTKLIAQAPKEIREEIEIAREFLQGGLLKYIAYIKKPQVQALFSPPISTPT